MLGGMSIGVLLLCELKNQLVCARVILDWLVSPYTCHMEPNSLPNRR